MKNLFLFFLLCCSLFACGKHSTATIDELVSSSSSSGSTIETGKVLFLNESSYKIIIHKDAFSGAILAELGTGQSKMLDIKASDNHGVGTTFSMEYLYSITNDFDQQSGTVDARGIDPNVQITLVIKANKIHTVQIPQPTDLEFPNAYFKILNSSDKPAELQYLSTVFRQVNGNLPIASGKIGVYEMEATATGKQYSDYTMVSVFETFPIPEFIAKSGTIYHLTYNGTDVNLDSEQRIIFTGEAK